MPEDASRYYRRKALERQGARNLRQGVVDDTGGFGAQADPAIVQAGESAARSAGDIRGTGTLTKYRPVGGWRTPGPGYEGGREPSGGNLRAVAEAAELGAPTSFDGGRGPVASQPIGVIRGLRQTFAPQRQEGQQFIEGEYSTPLRAGQAYNRAAGKGELEPVEGPNLRLRAELDEKNPLQKEQARGFADARLEKVLDKQFLDKFGVPGVDAEGKPTLTLPPEIQRFKYGFIGKSDADIPAYMEKIAPVAQKHREVAIWNDRTPNSEGFSRWQEMLRSLPKAEADKLMRQRVTPDSLPMFEARLQQARKNSQITSQAATPLSANPPDVPSDVRGLRRAAEAEERSAQNMRIFDPFMQSAADEKKSSLLREAAREREEQEKDRQFYLKRQQVQPGAM